MQVGRVLNSQRCLQYITVTFLGNFLGKSCQTAAVHQFTHCTYYDMTISRIFLRSSMFQTGQVVTKKLTSGTSWQGVFFCKTGFFCKQLASFVDLLLLYNSGWQIVVVSWFMFFLACYTIFYVINESYTSLHNCNKLESCHYTYSSFF